MKNIPNKLAALGFDPSLLESVPPDTLEHFSIAKIAAVHKDSYIVTDGENSLSAELIGKILFNASSPLDYPAVGDWVLASFYDDDTLAIIHEILPVSPCSKERRRARRWIFSSLPLTLMLPLSSSP